MRSTAPTVQDYLAGLPADRRAAIAAVRDLVRRHLPAGYEETIAWGMITWQVPLAVYPDTYNKQPLMYAALACQKNHMAVYLCNVYGHAPTRARFEAEWRKSGKKLDMGKSCVRFKKLDDLPLDVVGQAIARVPAQAYIERYEETLRAMGRGPKK